MSGERISGPAHSPAGSSSDGSSHENDAAWSSAHDDVELEKSNILMLGPTGAMMASNIANNLQSLSRAVHLHDLKDCSCG